MAEQTDPNFLNWLHKIYQESSFGQWNPIDVNQRTPEYYQHGGGGPGGFNQENVPAFGDFIEANSADDHTFQDYQEQYKDDELRPAQHPYNDSFMFLRKLFGN